MNGFSLLVAEEVVDRESHWLGGKLQSTEDLRLRLITSGRFDKNIPNSSLYRSERTCWIDHYARQIKKTRDNCLAISDDYLIEKWVGLFSWVNSSQVGSSFILLFKNDFKTVLSHGKYMVTIEKGEAGRFESCCFVCSSVMLILLTISKFEKYYCCLFSVFR